MRKRKNELAVVKPGEQSQAESDNLVSRVADIVLGYVQHNRLLPSEIPTLIASIYGEMSSLATGAPSYAGDKPPAVSIKRSIGDDFIICLEDGKKLTMLKRYLRSQYDMSPEEYRKKWGLPHDYPMVAPAYARLRSAFARKSGLGRSRVSRKNGSSTKV